MYEMLLKIADPVGVVGVIILLAAYFAVSIERLSSKSIIYQIMNFIAGWLILFSLFFHWNTPSVIIEVSWVLISVLGMYRIIQSRGR